jgi:quinol monooxygenase YgiN
MYRFVVKIVMQPGTLPITMAAAPEFTRGTLAETGCIEFGLYANFDGSDSFVVLEAFENHAAHRLHEASEHFRRFMATARQYFVSGKSETIVDDEA